MDQAAIPEMNLLTALTAGSAEAFRDIFERYNRRVFAFAFYLTKSREIAEDVVQEVFMKVWETRERIDTHRDFAPYLKTITQNHVYNLLKKAARDRSLQKRIEAGMKSLAEAHQPDKLQERELARLYSEAVAKLPPQKRIIYSMHRNDGLTYDQIAEKLGLSKNTVRNHLHEASRSVAGYVAGHKDLAILLIALCMLENQR